MMSDRLVAQKPLFTSSASIGMSPRTICTVQEFHLIVELARTSMVLRYLVHRKEILADIEILESNPGAVEDGNIVPRDPARTAPFEHRADCVQNEFAAFDPFANMLEFPDLDRLLRQIAKQPRTLEDLARQLPLAARVGPHARDVCAWTDPFRLEQRGTRRRRGDDDVRLTTRLFRRRGMDVEFHTNATTV